MTSAEIRFVDPEEWERAGFTIEDAKGTEDTAEFLTGPFRHPAEDEPLDEDWREEVEER